MKWTTAKSLLICLGLVLALFGGLYALLDVSAFAQDDLPHAFWGRVEFDGQPVPDGRWVRAEGDGVATGTQNPVSTEGGQYGEQGAAGKKLLVQSDDPDGIENNTPIAFYVDDIRAKCREVDPETGEYIGPWRDTYPFHAESITMLDLAVTGEYTLTVASIGCCPISVTYDTTTATVAAGAVGAFTNITGGVTVTLKAITETLCGFGRWESDLWEGDPVTATNLITIPMRYNDATITATCGFYSVTISPPTITKFGDPGDWVSYELQVSNRGDVTDTFDVTAVSSNTWSVLAPPIVGPLAAAEIGPVDALVKIPSGAAPCAVDVMTFTVTSRGDPHKSATALLTTIVTGDCDFYDVFLPLVARTG